MMPPKGDLECNCAVECEQTEYITQDSLAIWPSEQYLESTGWLMWCRKAFVDIEVGSSA